MHLSKTETAVVIVAIDGPAGAGKSTVAKKLAQRLKFSYLDTGAMYRALALKALSQKIDMENEDALVKLAKGTKIDLEGEPMALKVFLDGKDVSEEIRTLEVTNKTFYVARAPRIREVMVGWQRDLARKRSLVAEGRDIGTVVFPNAKFKFYLDADVKVRCRRRAEELRQKGKEVNEAKLLEEIKERDRKDKTRATGPLKQAEDATYIDTTQTTVDQVVTEILKWIKV